MKKILLIVTILSLLNLGFSDTNGIWTYSEDIQAGVFGADENNPIGSNYTFNDIVYFNENIYSSVNISANKFVSLSNSNQYLDPSGDSELDSINIDNELTIRGTNVFDLFVNRSGDTMSGNLYLDTNEVEANRFVDSQNTVYFLNPSGVSNLYRVASNRYYTNNGDNSKYLDPSRSSVINNLDVKGALKLDGENIENVFVSESGDTMSGNLNMGNNRIRNLQNPSSSSDAATKDYVDDLVPSGAIMAFDKNSCPSGWKVWEDGKGQFLRGSVSAGGNDPEGDRAPGDTQSYAMEKITGHINGAAIKSPASAYGAFSLSRISSGDVAGANGGKYHIFFDSSDVVNTATETRPKNVAVLFCIKE